MIPIRSVSLRLASAAAGPLIVWGCAAHPIDRDAEPASRELTARAGRPGFVVAAPHGRAEANTGEIVVAVARRSGSAMVVASSPAEAYERRGREVAQGPIKPYRELRGARDGVTPP